MLITFENLLTGKTKFRVCNDTKGLETRALWSVDDNIYWINKIIKFTSFWNVLITPLYAWECMAKNGDNSLFSVVKSHKGLTDKLRVKNIKTIDGMSDKSGNAIYMKSYIFDEMPDIKIGDMFVFDDITYYVTSFEVHKRIYGAPKIDRVIVVTHNLVMSDRPIVVLNDQENPLSDFIRSVHDVEHKEG